MVQVFSETVEISTEQELRDFALKVNEGYDYSGSGIVLKNDIALHGEWTPIGLSTKSSFKGTFDGRGYTISGLSINDDGSDALYFGLFGVSYGEISNVSVKGTIQAVNYSGKENRLLRYIGGIVGYTTANIAGCTNYVDITADYATIGGIAGKAADPEESERKIIQCVNHGTLQGERKKKDIILSG